MSTVNAGNEGKTASETAGREPRPELNLDPQTEELFRFIDTLKKLKESEDLEKGGAAAVVATRNSGNTASLLLGVAVLAVLGVIGYGGYVVLANQQHDVTDPVQIMLNAKNAFDNKRYDECMEWSQRILSHPQDNAKTDVEEAALMSIRSEMALDHAKDAAQLVDKWGDKFDPDSNASAERRGEFHHLEGELWLKLGRLNPEQQFLDAYKCDPKSIARLRDKFRYIQCLLPESNDIDGQLQQLADLKSEVEATTPAQSKDHDRADLLDQIQTWQKMLTILKS